MHSSLPLGRLGVSVPRTWLPSMSWLLLPSLVLAADDLPGSAQSTLRKLTYPGKTWSLVVDLPGFDFRNRTTRDDLTGVRIFGENERTGVVISVYLEKAERNGDAEDCRAYYWSRAKKKSPRPKDVRFIARKDMALVEYTTIRTEGVEIRQDNVSAFLSHDGVWIEIHLSKDSRRATDRIVFDWLLDSVRIVEQGRESTSAPSVAAATPRPAPLFLQAPGKQWGVSFEAPGAELEMRPLYDFDRKDYEITEQQVIGTQWDGRMEKSGLVFWVALGTADPSVDARESRDLLWDGFKRGKAAGMIDIRVSVRGDLLVVEYLAPVVGGRKADVKNTLAFLARDGIAGIVWIWKVDYRVEDAPAFEAVLDSIRIVETVPTPP